MSEERSVYENNSLIQDRTVTFTIKSGFLIELSGVTQTYVSLSCRAFEVRGATINDCVDRWHRLKHGIDDYESVLIKAIRVVVGGSEISRINF